MSSKRRAVVAAVAVVAVAIVLAAFAVGSRREAPTAAEESTKTDRKVAVAYASAGERGLNPASAGAYDALERENAGIKPAVAPYTLKQDLSNVVNLSMFRTELGLEQVALIAKNGFVVSPTHYIQMFHIYELNEYQRPQRYPSFITADSMLHTYHVFYDYTLRQIESEKLYDEAVKLTDAMLKASQADVAAAKSDLVKDAARRNVAYFAVARKVLTGAAPPANVKAMVEADLQRIGEHSGLEVSDVFGHMIDFSQFVPRGHYTRTEKLRKYFLGMMWYGLSSFPIPQKKIGPRPTRQALMVVRNLRSARCTDEPAVRAWNTVYEPTVFYVGSADDYTYYDYARLSDEIYDKNPSIEAFADEGKLKAFIAEVEKLPSAGIEQYASPLFFPLYPTGRQFRFMGQRFIPDSRILQEMVHPKVKGRYFPSGLDVFAALGSDRALGILRSDYGVNQFPGYDGQMNKMRDEMRGTPHETWQSNLYYGWIWSLQSLIGCAPQGYPTFMRGDAWLDRYLLCGLASWTELRHDTILYAKQSFTTAECGGSEEGEELKTPKGYVEPNLEFWTKLLWLNNCTREGLESRGLLSPQLKDRFEKLGDWLHFCRAITIKELTNQKVTDEEYEQICMYGAELEQLTQSFAGGDLLSDTDKDMAIVADVHSADKLDGMGLHCLEEATGRAGAIYVAVPIEGKLYLARGATYTHYEFTHPAEDRLTDEKWQQMLQTGNAPEMAGWMKSFFVDGKPKTEPFPEGGVVQDGGC